MPIHPHHTPIQRPLQSLIRWCLGIVWLFSTAHAQIIDENTPFIAPFPSVGEHGNFDLLAQSFVADINKAHKIGVWLRADSAGGEVQLALWGNTPLNTPDSNTVLYQSSLISPSTTGAWVYDSGFVALLTPGQTYWLVIDGHRTLTGQGYSSIGVSNQYTDTNLPLYGSMDGAQTWNVALGNPMAVYIEGDTCSFTIQITPSSPLICPDSFVTLSAPFGLPSYAWSTGGTASSIQVTSSGLYTVTVSDPNFCQTTASIILSQGTSPSPNLLSNYNVCQGSSVNLAAFPFYAAYLWSTGATTSTISVDSPGVYTLQIIDQDGCPGSDTATVTAYPAPHITLGPDTNLCQGQFILLDAGAGYLAYNWSNGSSGRSISPTTTGDYFVILTSANGCIGGSDTLSLQVNPNPTKPVISNTLGGISSTFGFAYTWLLDGDTLTGATSREIESPAPGLYQVIIANGFGCTAISDTFRVAIEQQGSFVSEGFSPNGDGLNEVFFVEGIENYPANLLIVFNRFGEEVYRKTGYTNDWHGFGPQGKPLPDGDYYYILEFGGTTPSRKGAVRISR